MGNSGNIEHSGPRPDEFSASVTDLHHHRRIRHDAVEPDRLPTSLQAEGRIAMRWIPDSYDLMIGAAIVGFLAIIAVVALI